MMQARLPLFIAVATAVAKRDREQPADRTHIKHRIPFIKKGSEYIEAYKFPDIHHALLKKKAQFNTCMVNGDDLLVFTL